MLIHNLSNVTKRERKGLTSHFMLDAAHTDSGALGITWVTVEPNARQIPHNHYQEQVYIIIQGSGVMQVDEEFQRVSAGDLVFIPSNAMHGINNDSDTTLSYVSAATPGFDLVAGYDDGQLTPEAYES